MSKVKKLTPAVLKKIILEEKRKIANASSNKKQATSKTIDIVSEASKLALQELKHLIEIKKIRARRNKLKK